jgi:hypothetical protein
MRSFFSFFPLSFFPTSLENNPGTNGEACLSLGDFNLMGEGVCVKSVFIGPFFLNGIDD